jgi:putative flippase GtrA
MRTARRWGLFNLIGCGGFVVQMATLSLLTRGFGWQYGWATALAIELAILHNFAAHTRWTWGDRRPAGGRALAAMFARYQFAKSLSIAANLAITAWLVSHISVPVEAASAAAVLCLSVVNFLIADALVFTSVHNARAGAGGAPADPGDAGGSNLAVAAAEVEPCDNSLRPLRSS